MSGEGQRSIELGDTGRVVAGEQDHRRLPHLAARVERSQLERRAFVARFEQLRCDQSRCEIERGGDRIGVVGIAVTEQRLRRERHADEVCDLGVDRRGQTRRQRRDHLVGLVTAGLDREGRARLQVDEHVRSRRADTELHERDARQADPARIVREQLDRHLGVQAPRLAATHPRRRQRRGPGQAQLDAAVAGHLHPTDLRRRCRRAMTPRPGTPRRRAPSVRPHRSIGGDVPSRSPRVAASVRDGGASPLADGDGDVLRRVPGGPRRAVPRAPLGSGTGRWWDRSG